jgi:four helix bundle protein
MQRGARHFRELTVWRLADELRRELLKVTGRPAYLRSARLREQTDDAIDSVCRNIAEGFGADTHGQFAWFLRISRRSLNEVQDAILSGQQKGILTAADLVPARTLIRRLYPALNRFVHYLEKSPKHRNRPAPGRELAREFYRRVDESQRPDLRGSARKKEWPQKD